MSASNVVAWLARACRESPVSALPDEFLRLQHWSQWALCGHSLRNAPTTAMRDKDKPPFAAALPNAGFGGYQSEVWVFRRISIS